VTWLVTVRRPSTPSMPITACSTAKGHHALHYPLTLLQVHSRACSQPRLSWDVFAHDVHGHTARCAASMRYLCCGQAEPQEHTFKLVPSANNVPVSTADAQHRCHGSEV
jgi:hypothetical protein